MNETLTTISARRAVRKYKDQIVERKMINDILEAGRMAPSAMNKQPWKFYILTDREMIKQFSKKIANAAAKGIIKQGLKHIGKMAVEFLHFPKGINFLKESDMIFHGAPVVIFITSPRKSEWASLDIGMCAQNMMLAAKAAGLDSCPVGLAKFVEQTKIYSKLTIPKSERVDIAIVIGYGQETPSLHERKKDNAIFL